MDSIKRRLSGLTRSISINENREVPKSNGIGSIKSFKKKLSPTPPPPLTYSKGTQVFDSDEDDMELPPVCLTGYHEETKHRILNPEICHDIRALMPTRIQLYAEWKLLYSLEQHGASLTTLYSSIKPNEHTNKRVGYVMAIEDMEGGIFGVYTNEYFHPTDRRRYYGNGECFLWKIEKHKNETTTNEEGIETHGNHNHVLDGAYLFQGYPYTGINEFNIYATSEFLSFGAGSGHYGLWVDHDLLNGVSDRCLTYGNEELSKQGAKFQIKALEVWRVG